MRVACRHHCWLTKIAAILMFIILSGGFLFGLPLETRANGPIPFTEEFTGFTGSGFDPNPGVGQLDSDIWSVTGLSDGDLLFGDSQTTGDFARGPSAGGVTTGGVYAFDVGGNTILGVQPGGTDFTPGEIILRLQNNTGSTITQLDVSYDIWYRNDQPRANSLNFSYSPDNVTYTSVPALDFTTPEVADASPVWQCVPHSTILTGLNLADGDSFYLKWTGDDVSGSGNRDEYGLDNVQVAVPGGDVPPSIANTVPNNGATGIPIDSNIEINFSEDVTLTGSWFEITCTVSGPHTATVGGGGQNYTLDPDLDFANGETCTVTILAAQVSDQDTDDPPDTMSADDTFSFTTIAAASGWVINEIHADPAPDLTGDANGDGIRDESDDEFIEIVNNTGSVVDISGWTLADGVGVKHTFPAGTIVSGQCPVVVFAGGTPAGAFGGATVQTASTGQLGLNNAGDTITLNDGLADQAVYTFGSEGGNDQSLTRDPDLIGIEPLVLHSTAAGSGGSLFSPGVRVDGSIFAVCGPPDTPPAILTTTPPNGATGVATDTPITIVFDEIVGVTTTAFALECPAGSPIAFNMVPPVPGNVDSFTLTLNSNLPNNTTCAVTILAAEVTDQDGPPDKMNTDYVFTFDTAAVPSPPAPVLIGEFLYDGLTPSTEGDEFVEVCNPNPDPVDLTGYKVGDEEVNGGGESMYQFPAGALLATNACRVVAKNAIQFEARFGTLPDFEVVVTGGSYADHPTVPNLAKYTAWGSGNWALSNTGDELLVLGPNDEILDKVAYRNGDYTGLQPAWEASASEPHSLQRIWPTDTDSMPYDFVRAQPNPGAPTLPPAPIFLPPAVLPDGMYAYWGDLHAHTSYSDGAGPPHYALAMARAAGLHFFAITDHGWWLSPDEWVNTLAQTTNATAPGQFVALRGVEWTHQTAGHINVFNSDTLLSRTDPAFDTLPELYGWLAANPDAIAQFNHPGANYDGYFDNFPFNPAAAPRLFMQEIGNNAQGYVTYEAAFIQSNTLGWRVAPTNNSDVHTANWGTDSSHRSGIIAPTPNLTQADVLAALRARRVFATEDSNLALTLRLDGAWMGSELAATGPLSLTVDFVDPNPEPLTLHVYDGNLPLATVSLALSTGQWHTTIHVFPGHFYWVKAVQADGDTAYTAPIWIEGQAPPETLYLNEILPAPRYGDWDGNGVADHHDEFIELYNPLNRPIGLGGWRLSDASNIFYNIPLGVIIPAGGFVTFFQAQTQFSLNNNGDTVMLTDPNGTTIDSYTYPHSPGYDETWCRLPDGSSHWSDNCGPSPHASNWEKPPPGPFTLKIFDAKRLTLGAWVKVRGRVTAPPGVLGTRTMYIQDETAGIMIYLPQDHNRYFNLGDKVEVVGDLRLYHEEFEIAVDDRSDVKFLEAGSPLPPLPIATTSLLEPYEGLLVMLQGEAVHFKGWTTMWLDDGTGWAKVYIRSSTGIKKPFIDTGAPVTAVGIVSQYSEKDNPSRDDYRLLPRYQTDLILPEPLPLPGSWPSFLPETGYGGH